MKTNYKCIDLSVYKLFLQATHGMSKDYSRLKFSLPKAGDRNFLADKALEFLRQASENTTAYNASSNLRFYPAWDLT